MAEQEQHQLPPNAPQPAVLPDEGLHKARLHNYCQKSGLLPPVYETVCNGGPTHMPQFTTTVTVDGTQYSSPNLFRNRKASQHDAAKIAYTALTENIKSEEIPSIFYKDTIFCKSALIEYGKKMKLENPTYTSTKIPGAIPLFSSTVNFNGVNYTGDIAKNKKEAEQLAARAAVISIMNSPEGSLSMHEIIKSKSKLYNSLLNLAKKSLANENDSSKVKEVENRAAVDNNSNDSSDEKNRDDDDTSNKSKIIEVQNQPLGQPTNLPASYPVRVEYQNPNLKPNPNLLMSNEALASTEIVFVPPAADPALIPGTSENKKRLRKQRNKQNKKKRLAQVPLDVVPLSQIPPCSVSQ